MGGVEEGDNGGQLHLGIFTTAEHKALNVGGKGAIRNVYQKNTERSGQKHRFFCLVSGVEEGDNSGQLHLGIFTTNYREKTDKSSGFLCLVGGVEEGDNGGQPHLGIFTTAEHKALNVGGGKGAMKADSSSVFSAWSMG